MVGAVAGMLGRQLERVHERHVRRPAPQGAIGQRPPPSTARAPVEEGALHSRLGDPTAALGDQDRHARAPGGPKRDAAAGRRGRAGSPTAAGGYVQSSNQQSSQTRSATVVVRVPAGAFEAAVNRLKRLGKVRSATEGGEDITRQLIDLNARLVNLQAQRRVLLGLMHKATTVAASILVENQLSQVQGAIEQLSGQLRYLHDRADFSTITLSMMAAGAPRPRPSTPAPVAGADPLGGCGSVRRDRRDRGRRLRDPDRASDRAGRDPGPALLAGPGREVRGSGVAARSRTPDRAADQPVLLAANFMVALLGRLDLEARRAADALVLSGLGLEATPRRP